MGVYTFWTCHNIYTKDKKVSLFYLYHCATTKEEVPENKRRVSPMLALTASLWLSCKKVYLFCKSTNKGDLMSNEDLLYHNFCMIISLFIFVLFSRYGKKWNLDEIVHMYLSVYCIPKRKENVFTYKNTSENVSKQKGV